MTIVACGTLQERMPEVAAGTAEWTPAEMAHLAGCDECAREWRIVSAARRLGGAAAGRIDPAAMATRVVAELGSPPRRRWGRSLWVSGLAAAAVVVLVLRVGFPGTTPALVPDSTALAAGDPVGTTIPMAELDALDADQLEAVLEQLDGAAATAPTGDMPAMGDLDDHQLERILRSLEG